MTNQRQYQRTPIKCRLKLWRDDMEEVIVQTRDVSDGGLFLLMDSSIIDEHPVGTIVKGQIQGMMDDAPIVTMEVVRTTEDGVGLRYILNTK